MVGAFHPNTPEPREGRRIQMPTERRLQTARAKVRGYGDLIKGDRVAGVLVVAVTLICAITSTFQPRFSPRTC